MKSLKIALAVSALALTAGAAHAEYYNPTTWNGGYASVKGGLNSIQDNSGVKFDTGYSFDGALGAHICPQVRVEGELGYQHADGRGRTDLGTMTMMANGYYDFNNLGTWSTIVTPYVGLGLGAAHHELSANGGGNTEWDVAYAAIAGASYAVTPKLAITADYKYLGTPSIDKPGRDVSYDSHNFLVGLRYSFK